MSFLKHNSLWRFLILVLLSFPSIASLLKPGFFLSDDAEWMVIRFSAFHQALADGEFPVRWLGRLNHEYGYPVANFLYPGFMYLAEPIHLLGFGFVDTIKIILGLSMVGSAVFCYFWLAKLFDRWPAMAGALFYLYTPYHLFDLYKRGSVGEVLALAVVPFILWQIERKNLFLSSIGIAFLILSHNTLALLFVPFIFLYMALNLYVTKIRRELLYKYFYMILLGFGGSAFFWIPAIFDLQFTIFQQTAISEWNKYFVDQGLVGASLIVIFITTFILLLTQKIKASRHRLTVLLFVIGSISLLISMPISEPLWIILPVPFIQFPSRFLSVTILCASFLAAAVTSILPGKLKIAIGFAILILALISSKPFIAPSLYFDKGEGFYATNVATTTVQNEYMPKWVRVLPTERPLKKVEIVSKASLLQKQNVEHVGRVDKVVIKNNLVTFNADMSQNGVARVNTIYFPGWKAFINGKATQIDSNNKFGIMDVALPEGKHAVVLRFSETPVRLVSDMISIAALIILFGFTIVKRGTL